MIGWIKDLWDTYKIKRCVANKYKLKIVTPTKRDRIKIKRKTK